MGADDLPQIVQRLDELEREVKHLKSIVDEGSEIIAERDLEIGRLKAEVERLVHTGDKALVLAEAHHAHEELAAENGRLRRALRIVHQVVVTLLTASIDRQSDGNKKA